jgi:hypothetical protein|tara:strand:+ start:868 stop:1113 length:246 start_codon:yes stop_codon:yes gene_type:complete
MSKDLEKDFDLASDMMNELLDDFDASDLQAGAAMGGALTALLFRLMVSSPDNSTTMGMLSSAMNQAATFASAYEVEEETKH